MTFVNHATRFSEWLLTIVWKLSTYALGLLVIYWLLLKLTGHSPTSDQILVSYLALMTTLIIAIGGVLFKLVGDVRELKGQFVQHVKQCDERLGHKK